MAAVENALDPMRGWHGALTLELRHDGTRTCVAKRRHEGPFCLQRPFYPEDGACHLYLLHPPGGLAAGDRLVLDVQAQPNTAVLLTTPAATKFYRSDGAPSTQTQVFTAVAGATLEWLPQDTILFGGSRAHIATEVRLDASARYIGWDLTSLGRPLSGDDYSSGALEQRMRIEIDGKPRLRERLAFDADAALRAADWGLAGFGLWGTLYAYPADATIVAAMRSVITAHEARLADATAGGPRLHAGGGIALHATAARCAVTLLDGLLVLRYLGTRPEAARALFEAVWSAIREAVTGRAPSAPRIWRT